MVSHSPLCCLSELRCCFPGRGDRRARGGDAADVGREPAGGAEPHRGVRDLQPAHCPGKSQCHLCPRVPSWDKADCRAPTFLPKQSSMFRLASCGTSCRAISWRKIGWLWKTCWQIYPRTNQGKAAALKWLHITPPSFLLQLLQLTKKIDCP